MSDSTTAMEPLEEQVELLDSLPVAPFTIGEQLADLQGVTYRLTEVVNLTAQLAHYLAENEQDEVVAVYVALTSAAAIQLRRQEEALSGLNYRMFPKFYACLEKEEHTVLITERMAVVETLADRIQGHGLPFTVLLSTLAQVSVALSRLHAKGWVYLGLRPGIIALGKPVFLTDFSYIMPTGQKPEGTFYHAGYSPPELLTEEPLDASADIYSIGAILFHALNGQPMAETGAELSTWEPPVPMGGVPQILQRCLGSRETRYARMEDLHHDLLRLARRYAPRLSYRISTATTIGLEPTRTTNQDAFAVLQGEYETEAGSQTWALACVADGMGGMAAGDVASDVAVKTVLREATEMFASGKSVSTSEQTEGVKTWAMRANERVCAAMEERKVRGGCTLIVTCMIGSRLTIAHVGDCRLYHIRQRNITLLTRDHSLAMAMVLQGNAELEDIRQHPDRSRVTRSLGERQNVPDYYVDTLESATGNTTLELENDDTLLLCSDGLWEPVVDDEMRDTIARHAPDLSAAGEALLQIALERGGPDNATVVLLRVEEKPAYGED